jgi:hypothetical protein
MKHLNNKLVIGIAAVIVGLSIPAYTWWQRQKEKRREQLLTQAPLYAQILRRFRREFYPVFEYLKALANTIQQQHNRNLDPRAINVEKEIKRAISPPNSVFNLLMGSAVERVYEEFEITDPAKFERECKELATLDVHIQFLWTDIENMRRRARAGIGEIAPVSGSVLNNLSKQLTFQTQKQLVWDEIQARYSVAGQHCGWTTKAQRDAITDLELAKMRLEVLDQNGFNNDEDIHSELLFAEAINHFSTLDNYFRINIEALDTILQRVRQDFQAGTLRATPLASIRADVDWVILN